MQRDSHYIFAVGSWKNSCLPFTIRLNSRAENRQKGTKKDPEMVCLSLYLTVIYKFAWNGMPTEHSCLSEVLLQNISYNSASGYIYVYINITVVLILYKK